MALKQTPICDFGTPAVDFRLPGVDGKDWTLADCRGARGTVVAFLCNHCPYVQALRVRLVADARALLADGVKFVAIMPNDTENYPEDSFENMRLLAKELDFPFPYLLDDTQEVARAYGAVATPDFFGYNTDLALQYRGRLDAGRLDPPPENCPRDLLVAMRQVAQTGQGPREQQVSTGCSIKWRH